MGVCDMSGAGLSMTSDVEGITAVSGDVKVDVSPVSMSELVLEVSAGVASNRPTSVSESKSHAIS